MSGRVALTAQALRARQIERFLAIRDAIPPTPSGCLLWPRCLDSKGYGHYTLRLPRNGGSRHLSTHRLAWEIENGPIPADLQIDHLCRNRACLNTGHMRIVTCRENVLCGVGLTAINARKKACIRGHQLTGRNVRHEGNRRRCRACENLRHPWTALRREQQAARRLKYRAALLTQSIP